MTAGLSLPVRRAGWGQEPQPAATVMGLVVELAPFRRLLQGTGQFRPNKEYLQMKKESCDNYIATLKKVRDEYSSQLDDGVVSNLEQLITDLEQARGGKFSAAECYRISVEALEAIGVVLSLVSNIQDWLK